jgi:hypothetical protein
MKFCPQCGAALIEGAKFCTGCGVSLGGMPKAQPGSGGGFAPFERQIAKREKNGRRWVKWVLGLAIVPGLTIALVIVNIVMTERANHAGMQASRASQPISLMSPQDMPDINTEEPSNMVLILRRFDVLPGADRTEFNLPSEPTGGMSDAPGQGGPGLIGPAQLPEPL